MNAKKAFKPVSLLFMFSDTPHPNVADWFSGNIVIEYDLSPFSRPDLDELEQMAALLRLKGYQPGSATVVTNFNPHAVTLAQLSGHFSHIYKLDCSDDWKQLNKLNEACQHYVISKHHLETTIDFFDDTLRLMKRAKCQDLAPLLSKYKTEAALFTSTCNDMRNKICETFDAIFKIKF